MGKNFSKSEPSSQQHQNRQRQLTPSKTFPRTRQVVGFEIATDPTVNSAAANLLRRQSSLPIHGREQRSRGNLSALSSLLFSDASSSCHGENANRKISGPKFYGILYVTLHIFCPSI
jgi:hypothetical protein